MIEVGLVVKLVCKVYEYSLYKTYFSVINGFIVEYGRGSSLRSSLLKNMNNREK